MDQMPPVVVLCGGRGSRLGPDTEVLPKPLVKVGGRPILWHIMSHYAGFGFTRFILCLGYQGDRIRDYFLGYRLHHNDFTLRMDHDQPTLDVHLSDAVDWEVTCAETGLEAQTGARISRIRRYVTTDDFLCTYGDGVSDVDIGALMDFHRAHGRMATVTGVLPPARWGELVLGADTEVERFEEKPRLRPRTGPGFVNGGFFVFNRRIFDYLDDRDDCVLEGQALERLAAEGELQIYRHSGFWQCMDVPKDRDMLDDYFRRERDPERDPEPARPGTLSRS
jgi:glucose-1-phosphate cytidylyltransferase